MAALAKASSVCEKDRPQTEGKESGGAKGAKDI